MDFPSAKIQRCNAILSHSDKFYKLFDRPALLRFLDFDVHLARVTLVKLHISQEESFESRVTTMWLPSRLEPMWIFFSWVYSSWCLSPHRGARRKTCHRLGGASVFCTRLPVALALEDDASNPLVKGFHSSDMGSSGQRSSLSLGPDFGWNISKFRHRNNRDEVIHVTLNDFVALDELDSASRRPRIGVPQFKALQAR